VGEDVQSGGQRIRRLILERSGLHPEQSPFPEAGVTGGLYLRMVEEQEAGFAGPLTPWLGDEGPPGRLR
jgi:hypothetical protein